MSARPFTTNVADIADALNAGGIAIVPTDTVYGIAASLDHPDAIQRIYVAKGRPADKPIPILVDSRSSAMRFVCETTPESERLMRVFWPGPLTIILKASVNVPGACRAVDETVGLRMPDHALQLELIARCGGGLAVTSANRSGEQDTSTASEAYAALCDYVDIVFDSGPLAGGAPSTVIDATGEHLRVVRHGALPAERIKATVTGQQ